MSKSFDYKKLFTKVEPLYVEGRVNDVEHIKSLIKKIEQLESSGEYGFNPKILLAAAILHDVGFGFLKQKHMHYFSGQEKVTAMKDAVLELTLAYVETALGDFDFSTEEIDQVKHIIKYSDEDPLPVKNPSSELVLLHDLNLFDRFLPHRVQHAVTVYPDKTKLRKILEKSLQSIITLQIKDEASTLAKQVFNQLG